MSLLLSFSAAAADSKPTSTQSHDGFNVYFAEGQNFIFPGAFRIGWNSWEYGVLDTNLVGAIKNFPIGDHTYTNFGFAIDTSPYAQSVGFQAGIGFNYNFFWKFGVRGELVAKAIMNGTTLGHGLIGISYGF